MYPEDQPTDHIEARYVAGAPIAPDQAADDRRAHNERSLLQLEDLVAAGRLDSSGLAFARKRLAAHPNETLYVDPKSGVWYTSDEVGRAAQDWRDKVLVDAINQAIMASGPGGWTLEDYLKAGAFVSKDGILRIPVQESHEQPRQDPGFDFDLGRHDAPPQDEAEEPRRSSWSQRDVTPVLNGTFERPQATVGYRGLEADGVGLFYPGRTHSVLGESEALKTWFALLGCLQEIQRGNHVLYIDFEDDEGGVVGRLLDMGAMPDDIFTYFHYIRPEDKMGTAEKAELAELFRTFRPVLVVIDGVTEAMAMHDLEITDNTAYGKFNQMLMKPMARFGAAVTTLDHVTKSKENRGRYAIGAVHKLNGITGAQYILENRTPLGIGLTGKSTVLIAKDRGAQLRRHGLRHGSGMTWFGDLVVCAERSDFIDARLWPPFNEDKDKDGKAAEKAQEVQDRILKLLADIGRPMKVTEIKDKIGGRSAAVTDALLELEMATKVVMTPQGLSKLYQLPASEAPADGSLPD